MILEPYALVGVLVGSLVAGAVVGALVGWGVGPAAVTRAFPVYSVAVLPLLLFGWLGLLPSLAIAYLGSALLTRWTLRRAAAGTLDAVPPAAVPAPAWVHANALAARGFHVVTALRLVPSGLREQFLIELADPHRACFAQVNAIVGASRQSVSLISAYPAGSLRTTSARVSMANPGELVRALPDGDIDALLAAHEEDRATLRALGFEPMAAEPTHAEAFARARIAAEAELVRRIGLLDVTAISRRSRRHRAAIAAQPDAGTTVDAWRSGGAGGSGGAGDLRLP